MLPGARNSLLAKVLWRVEAPKIDMRTIHNEDVVELQQDALGAILTLCAGGWVAVLVGSLLYRELGGAWFPVPLALTLVALLGAAVCQHNKRYTAAALMLVAGLLAGPITFVLLHGFSQPALFLFVLPIVVANILLAPHHTQHVTVLAVACIALLAFNEHVSGGLQIVAQGLGLAILPIFTCLVVASTLFFNALNIRTMIDWALDSQRKDARRAELFRQQQEELRQALAEIESTNLQLRVLNVQLGEARRVAETANQLKTRFLANVSHELRAPLHVILGLTEGAIKQSADAPTRAETLTNDLQHVQRNAKHLHRLINDLLDLSRAEIDGLELYPETVDTRALVADVFQSMASSREPQGAVLWRSELPERLPLIQADPVRLRQILFNLLSNAAKFTPAGTITVGAATEPPYLHLWVADTGSGIPLDQQERIFQPFASAHGRGRPEGVGLGLSITRRLVALHGGAITLESQPDSGSTFHIYLPLPDLQGQAATIPDSGQPVLLLLSSQQMIADEIQAVALRQHLPLRRAGTVTELTNLLREAQPAGVVWDLEHASAEDWPMIQYLRSHPQFCCMPLLLFGQSEGNLPDLSMGVTEVLIKPLSETTLAESIQSLHPRAADGPILVVDDDPQVRGAYTTLLVRVFPHHTVVEAEDGAMALTKLAEQRPCLVILDLAMPEVDGFTVLEALRANAETQRTPVLVLSGRLLSFDDVERLRHAHVTFQSKDVLSGKELAAQALRLLDGESELATTTSVFVKQAIAFIHQNYGRAFTRQEIAGFVGVSERYLTDIFHQELGLSVWEYLHRFRVAQAQQLLRSSEVSIGEIAAQVGFENAHYFTRVFRRVTGMAPRDFRELPATDTVVSLETR